VTACRRLLLVLALVLGLAPAARAESLVEKVFETRTYLYFKIAEPLAQGALPPGWLSAPVPQGPAKGANLILVLIDRLLATDAAGTPLDPAANRLLVLVVPGRDAAARTAGPVVVGGISDADVGAPGAYGAYNAGKVDLIRQDRDGVVDEDWNAEAPNGDRLTLNLSYARGLPALLTFDQKTYSGADPTVYRTYRGDWGVDFVRSDAAGVDRATRLELAASGPLLGRLLDDSQELVSLGVAPWYRRETFLP
jgi:hypothetical protein